MSEFRRDIEKAINRNSMENGSDTPDYILARFLDASLAAFDLAVKDRDEWHGFKAWPTEREKAAFKTEETPPPCPDHREIQHRDRRPPWCNTCGWRHAKPGTPAQKEKT